MNSITPPPTGGGNAKYAVVAVLLLGGMLGLWLWRSSSDKPQTIVIHAPDANAPTTMHTSDDDDVPPPPPIPDAGPDTGTTRITSNNGGNQAVCNATRCSGIASGDLESALAFRAKQAHSCYDSALANDSSLKGKIAISVRVASNGQVCNANVASNDMGSAAVAQCVANKFRQTGFFPAPKGGCIDATVPMNFVPGGK
jgi:hypothetical protein